MAQDDRPSNAAQTPRPCPICRKPSVEDFAPFCSKRCADVDLHRWLGGVYAVPAEGDDAQGTAADDDET